jgi:hypothetical protein
MKIIGHPLIPHQSFVRIESEIEMLDTPSASVLIFEDLEAQIEWVQHCQSAGLPFMLRAEEPTEAIIAHNLGATYLLVAPESAEMIQAIAQHYLFDMLILVPIDDASQIAHYAHLGIDGVIYRDQLPA